MKIVGPIPEHVRRLMPPEERKALGAPTCAEVDEKLRAKSEKQLQENIGNMLRQFDIIYNVSRMDRKKTDMVGWPDFTFAIHGRAFAFEVKLPGGKLTPDQERVIDHMKRNGWLVLVVRSEAEALSILKALLMD